MVGELVKKPEHERKHLDQLNQEDRELRLCSTSIRCHAFCMVYRYE